MKLYRFREAIFCCDIQTYMCKKLEVNPVQWFNYSEVELFQNPCSKLNISSQIWCTQLENMVNRCNYLEIIQHWLSELQIIVLRLRCMELEPLKLHCLMLPKSVQVHSKSLK